MKKVLAMILCVAMVAAIALAVVAAGAAVPIRLHQRQCWDGGAGNCGDCFQHNAGR